ncbi:hypothetical protein [Evansella tamaricis]|uniref:Uncharacterized protein n=1 Tax=Evansella tamaricis TaxID=2069301 RepID=A0ABS6JBK6_9BACI|nr:hypothetical protein [Evansella tamaricis]MBU9711061.1 hypothetical protein [Evansella tamaricis]
MAVKKFEFKQTYEEIEAGGKVYRMYMDDESLKKYKKLYQKYQNEYKDIQNIDEESFLDMSDEEQESWEKKSREIIENFITGVLGEGSFDELYELSGRSLLNMSELVYFLVDLQQAKTHQMQNEKVQDYYKKRKKKGKSS